MRRVVGTCCGLAWLLCAGVATAHEFTCEETFDGKTSIELSTYPVTVEARVQVTNTHPTSESVAQKIDSLVLDYGGNNFSPSLTLPVGASAEKAVSLVIGSYEQCLDLAALDGVADDRLVAPVSVEWDFGVTQCWAELICKPPVCEGAK